MSNSSKPTLASRLADLSPVLGLAIVLLAALSWHDVLPGGWRLRSLFEPDSRRQARADAAQIAARLAEFAEEDPSAAPGSIVFLGSSTIERFPLATAFPGKPCMRRGIANLSARSLLANLPDCLPAARPSGLVIYSGGVDWRASGRDANVLIDRVGAVLDEVRRRLPEVPVVLLGILPQRRMDSSLVEALRRANDRLARLATEKGVAFVPSARPPIADVGGALSERFSTDDLHLNEEGYRHLARWIVEDGGEVGRLLAP